MVICKFIFLIKCTFSISILFDYYLLHCASSMFLCRCVFFLRCSEGESSCDFVEIVKSLIYIYFTRVLRKIMRTYIVHTEWSRDALVREWRIKRCLLNTCTLVYAHILTEISIFTTHNSSSNNNKHDYSISHESLMYARTHARTNTRYGLIQIEWFCFGISTILHVLFSYLFRYKSIFSLRSLSSVHTNLGEWKTSFNAY